MYALEVIGVVLLMLVVAVPGIPGWVLLWAYLHRGPEFRKGGTPANRAWD